MGKICLIKQSAGLGDILFLQKLVSINLEIGNIVIFPIIDSLLYIKDYIKKPGLEFVSINSDFPYKEIYQKYNESVEAEEVVMYDMQSADRKIKGCLMRAKYKSISIEWEDWADYLNFERNYKKEDELYYNILNLKDDSEYNFINKRYGTIPNSLEKEEVKSNNSLQNIIMEVIPGYTVFDWLKIIENAKHIYTVDTSVLFLIEKINVKAKSMDMWARHNHYVSIDGLFNKKYKYN